MIMTMRRRDYATIGLALLLFVASMALYARTAAPGLLDGDEGEFQINIFRLGVSHTGYPTFFMLGKVWTMLVPIGTMATRANLFAAFWGALAVAAVFVGVQFLTRNRWVAVLSALLFAVSRIEWSQSIIPRPYTLNSLFVIVVPILFFLWRIGKVDLTWPIFALGLSLTNHRTMIWFGPAIALFILIADYRDVFAKDKPSGNVFAVVRTWLERSTLCKPRRIMALVIAFVVPLLLYGYVFWRGESDVGVEFHMKDFNDMILGGNARIWMRYGPLDWVISRITDLYIPLLVEQFTPVGFVAGLIGLVALALDRRPKGWPAALPPREVWLFLVLSNIGNSMFCVFFWTIDVEKFFLPSFIMFLFFVATGIALTWDWLSDRLERWRLWGPRLAQAGLAAVFVVVTGWMLVKNFGPNDFSGRVATINTWQDNLSQPLEKHALIVGPWESLTPLEYSMYVDGRRLDLERWKVITVKAQIGMQPYGSRQQDVENQVRAGRPVYFTVYPAETETLTPLVDEFRMTRLAGFWRLVNLPPTTQPPQGGSSAVFTDQSGRALELLGASIYPTSTIHAGDFNLVTFFWRMPQSIPERLNISLRLTDAQGHRVVQRDSEPSSGRLPTNGWLPNEVIQDDAGYIIPPDAPPGTYHLTAVVYNAATGENLKANGSIEYAVGDLVVAPPVQPPDLDTLTIPYPLDMTLAPLRVIGYALDKPSPKGGDGVDLSLWWQLDEPVSDDSPITISLPGATLYSGAPIPNDPVNRWARGTVVRGHYPITLPLDFAGMARLTVALNGRSVELPGLDVKASGRTFAVPQIAHAQTAQIGDSIKLLGYDTDKASPKPGDTVKLTLYWQALKNPAQSYTVFTHALDAGGVLRGQKDSVSRNGDLPTNLWLPGEVIADSYEIQIPRDAPQGTYVFEVGMYLPETGVRLPVFDANGARMPDDRILLAGKRQP